MKIILTLLLFTLCNNLLSSSIERFEMIGNSRMRLVGTVKPNVDYSVEFSGDMKNWERLANVNSPSETLDLNLVMRPGHRDMGFFRLSESHHGALILVQNTRPITTAAAGDRNVVIMSFSALAENEDILLDRLALRLRSGRPADLEKVSVWSGNVNVGEAVFDEHTDRALVKLTTPIHIQRGEWPYITVRGDISSICNTCAMKQSGSVLAVDVENSPTDPAFSTSGVGKTSGDRIQAFGSTLSSGVIIYKSFPVISKIPIASVGILTNSPLLRFKVTASSGGPISIAKMVILVYGNSVEVGQINMFAFSDSAFTKPIDGFSSGGRLMVSPLSGGSYYSVHPESAAGDRSTVEIPAGETVYFEVQAGHVRPYGTNYSVDTWMPGDTGSGPPLILPFEVIDNPALLTHFIWSPNSLGPSMFSAPDWTDGSNIPGYSYDNIIEHLTN